MPSNIKNYTVNVNGENKLTGKSKDGVFFKQVQRSKHLFRKANAWKENFIEQERWKFIKGYKGFYKISDYGRVKSYYNGNGTKKTKIGKILNKYKCSKGYYYVCLYLFGKKKSLKVARLVAQSFICNLLHKEQINHKDGVKINNYYKNLEWCTRSENMLHAYKVLGNGGGARKGEDNHWAKLTLKKVEDIREIYKQNKIGCVKIARLYNVSKNTILSIINNKTWKGVYNG